MTNMHIRYKMGHRNICAAAAACAHDYEYSTMFHGSLGEDPFRIWLKNTRSSDAIMIGYNEVKVECLCALFINL